jgi:hypothetical protein
LVVFFISPDLLLLLFFGRSIFKNGAQEDYCAANNKHNDDYVDSGVVLKNVEIHTFSSSSLMDNLLRHFNELNVMFLISHLLAGLPFPQ